MSGFKVYSKDGKTVRCELHKFEFKGIFMGERYVTATINSEVPIDFEIGDYFSYRGEDFTLNYVPAKEKKARKGEYGESFVYDSVKFNSFADELTRCDFLDYVAEDNMIHYTGLSNFSFYANSVSDLAERIQVNLDRLYTGTKKWTVVVDKSCSTSDKSVSVSSVSCFDALALVNSEFYVNYTIKGRTITIGAAAVSVGKVFGYGKGQGLYDLKQTTDQDTKIITRLRAFGSTKNMPYRYYNKHGMSESQYCPNLMLPDYIAKGQDTYIDADGYQDGNGYVKSEDKISLYGIREGTVYFDGSEDLFGTGEDNDIYPTLEGMTYAEVKAAGYDITQPKGDNGILNELLSAENPDDDGIAPEDGTTIPSTFKIRIKDFGVDLSEREDGAYKLASSDGTMTVSMKSGMCQGREFEIVENGIKRIETEEGYICYELECNRVEDMTFYFPNKTYTVNAGDEFVLINIQMPDVYVETAEQRLKASALLYLKEVYETKYKYEPYLDEKYMAEHEELAESISEGMLLNFSDTDLGIAASVTISQLTIKVGEGLLPTYEVTLNDDVESSTIDKITAQVDKIASNLNSSKSGGGISTSQINSIVQSIGSLMFLSKTDNDTASGVITFNEGLKSDGDVRSKEFVTGIVGGKGWKTDKDGNFEVESLTARSYIGAPEFRFNYIDAVAGEMWQTNGYGVIASVDTESRTATLRLEDGVYGTLAQNDICRGMFCNFGEGQQVEGTDECGFPTLYGFSTAYFTPTEIIQNAAGVMVFRYAIKSGTTMHPCVNMRFASYGNFTDSTRQRTTYFCKDYLRMLRNVSTWEINTKKSVCVQLGKLDGLQYGSQDLTGEGLFCQDGYFVNSWVQLRPEQIAELQGDSAYSVNLTGEEGIITIDEEGNIVGGTTAMYNVTAGDENVTTGVYNVTALGYRLQTRIQAFKGTEELEYSDSMEGEGYFVVGMHCVGCSATLVNGVVTIISITDKDNCYVNLTVNCEGNATFDKTYQVSAVTNGSSPLIADIDNEMDAVACDSDGKVLFGLPLTTNVSVWVGTTQLSLDKIEMALPDGVTATADKSTGEIKVTAITDAAAQTLPIGIKVTATWVGMQYTKSLTFTVTKQVCGENALLYQLLPSVSSVKIDDEGNYSVSSISCKITQSDGKSITTPTSLPSGLKMTYSLDGSQEKSYTYGQNITLGSTSSEVAFNLYNGSALIDKETVPIIKDGASNIYADFDNEMDAVACDEDGNVLDGFLPVSTIFSMYAGNSQLTLASLSSTGVSGVSVTCDKATGKVSVTSITKEAAATLRIPITGTATYGGVTYQRTLYFVVNKQICGENAKIYQLLPSLSAIKKDKDGNYTSSYLSCKLRYTNGAVSSDTTTLPSGYTMKYALDGGTAASYTINSTIKTAGITQQVTFYLYNGSTLLDVENVPVIIDGTDGQVNFTSYVFQRSNTEPTKPTGGSYTSPVPSGWSDGIPDGEAMVWMSKRVFTNDGLSPQDEEWSDPKQMTDTADFDVDYSSLASPSAPSGHPNTTSGWSNSTKDAIWMATSNCRNGVWSDWVVTKIVGEDAEIYQLVLSTKAVKIDVDGSYTATTVTCGVKKTSGLTTTTLSSLPSGFTLKVSRDGGTESTYTLGSSFTVSPATNKITFSLYEGSVLRTFDEICITQDGADGSDGDSPEMFEMTPNNISIRQSRTGAYEPSSVTIECYRVVGGMRTAYSPTSCGMEYSTDGTTWKAYSSGNYSQSGNKITIKSFSTDANFYRVWIYAGMNYFYAYQTVILDGLNGTSIESVDEYYAISASGTTAPSSGWSKTAPTPTTSKPYLWNYEVVNYSDGTSETKDKHLVGYLGADGSAGKGISSVTEYYAVSSSKTTAPTSWYTTLQSVSSTYPYLWNYTKIVYTDGTYYESTAQVIGNYAKDGATGATGAMPRYRGVWTELSTSDSNPYVYDSNYRDIVLRNSKAYIVASYNTKLYTEVPGSSSYWTEVSETFSFVAMDTALIDGANIAGFMFKDNKMVSQEGDESVVLDGVNGTITAKGSFTSGDADGQRIVMDGDDKSVKIYDESDNLVNEITGGEVVEDLIPDGVTASGQKFSQEWTMKSASSGQTKEDSLSQSDHLKVRGSGTLTLSVTGIEISINRTTSTLTTYPSVTCYGRLINATTNSVVSLLCYKKITQTSSATYNSETISDFTKQITIEAGEYYVRFDFILNRGSDTSVTFDFAAQLSDLAYTEDFFASIHAKNGFVVSQNSDNYLSAAITSKLMELCLVGSGNGLKIGANGIQVRSNSSTVWKNMPMLLYKCRVICSKSSSTISYSVTVDYAFDGSTGVTASRSAKGKVSVTLPSTSPTVSMADMVHAIGTPGLGYTDADGSTAFVTLVSISTRTLSFYISDDDTLNDASFVFDVWKL